MRCIETARLRLGPFTTVDREDWHALVTDPGVRRFLFDDVVLAREETEQLLLRNLALNEQEGTGLFALREHDVAAVIGFAGYWYFHEPPVLELGYALVPSAWGRGLAVEASRAVLDYGAQALGLTTFRASTDAPNVQSIRVLDKLGFRESHRTEGVVHETIHFVLEGQ